MNGLGRKRWARLLLALCLSGTLPGCGGDKTLQVSGTVRFEGQPVPAGLVWIDPDVEQDFAAGQGFARIKDGHFNTAQEGRNVVEGPYLIRIQAYDGKPEKGAPLGKPLRAEYREKVVLSAGKTSLNIDLPREEPGEPPP